MLNINENEIQHGLNVLTNFGITNTLVGDFFSPTTNNDRIYYGTKLKKCRIL